MRWTFLLVSLCMEAAFAVPVLLRSSASTIQLIALLALVLLAGLQVVTYRRGGAKYPFVEIAAEGLLVGVVVLSGGAELSPHLWLAYQTLQLRVLFSSWPHMLAAVCAQILALFGVLVLVPTVHGEPSIVSAAAIGGYVAGFVVAGGLLHLISTAAIRHERGAARERSLARAGLALVAAADREAVFDATLHAAADLLSGTPLTSVALTLREPDGASRIVAAAGDRADLLRGVRIDPSHMPARGQSFGEHAQSVIEGEATMAVQAALGLPCASTVVTLTQLRVNRDHIGTLVVESPARLPTDTADGLTTLAAGAALALESARLRLHLHELAYHDPLTGLANRTQFVERIQGAVARARSSGTTLAVLYLDVDDFKIVNDNLGHSAGDLLLRTVAERLRACIGDTGLVARIGGDEFTVLLEDVAGADSAHALAERVTAELRRPLELNGHRLTVGVSVGIALSQSACDEGADEAGDLLRAADVALYAAKARGKGQAAMFEPTMASQTLDRMELEGELRDALEQGAFEVYYQPLVDFASGAIRAVEALVRWNHPERGTVGPATFISIAEDSGLIVPLGRWVLETACRDARRWQTQYPTTSPLQVNVNLSANQLRDPNLVDDVRRILTTTGLDPATLKLEVTESVAVANTLHNWATLTELRQLGIRLAIDDFGTGNSAMDYLRRFPVDTLKIDRSFVQDLGRDQQTTALVRGMIAFAKSLGLHVTGEGIETTEQSAQLRSMGCDLGQGFLFARPLPAQQLEQALALEHSSAADGAVLHAA